MKLPVIGITLGDPGGIGPEVTFKAVLKQVKDHAYIPLLFGSKSVIDHPFIKQNYLKNVSLTHLSPEELESTEFHGDTLYFVDCGELPAPYVIGQPDKFNGQSALDALLTAVTSAEKGIIKALVTAPLSKDSFHQANIEYTGHTSLLADLTGSAGHVSMAFFSDPLKIVLVTIHTPLKQVSDLITEQALQTAVDNSYEFAERLGLKNPRIVLPGLNPHAGEEGLFGEEEARVLAPFVLKTVKAGKPIIGPLPPDTVFYRAYHGEFDIVIALYHDQGLIPLKMLAFDKAVNITLGLPFIRTSPDHGTAFDIAYKNKASSTSMEQALKLACEL
ncbi:4-hydroxythreonine-4-phosphate dehydrogenase PdxA [Thermoproteota archaeon]